jgi:hypothetical protein
VGAYFQFAVTVVSPLPSTPFGEANSAWGILACLGRTSIQRQVDESG